MKKICILPYMTAASIVISLAGCVTHGNGTDDVQPIAMVGASVLTKDQLSKAMPGGLNRADSSRFASAYIRRWIDSRLISDIAASEIDMSEIDRLVEDYRNDLIEMEYRRQMFESHINATFPDDSLRKYYNEHAGDFILERPMIQGIYLKVPDDAKNLQTIRRLYRSDNQADIDKLEKEVLASAIHYDYFRDKWIDWEQIESRIPYDFGDDAASFLRKHDHFETTAGGFAYLLGIKDILPAGTQMPFDNAKPLIAERMTARLRQTYDATLLSDLYKNALEKGRIQLFVELEH